MAAARWPQRLLLAALAAYCVALGVALLAPTSTEQSHLVLELRRQVRVHLGIRMVDFTQPRAEFLCNALILVPVSALGSLAWPRTTWRDWTAWGFVAAGLVELVQWVLLPDRTASFADVVANALGGLGGAVVVLVARGARGARG